jgi:hypothetical protein
MGGFLLVRLTIRLALKRLLLAATTMPLASSWPTPKLIFATSTKVLRLIVAFTTGA